MRYKIQKNFLDSISFTKLFWFWVVYMAIFGIIFFALSATAANGIIYKGEKINADISGFGNAMFFSFISAASASLGYVDIVPVGLARFFAVIEAVSGLLIFGILVSKLVSIRQNKIINEIYEISFDKNIDRIRSSLYLFRKDLEKIIHKTEQNIISKRQIDDMWITMTTLDTALYDLYNIICKENDDDHLIELKGIKLELIINSLQMSFKKLNELIDLFNNKPVEWKNEEIMSSINSDISYIETVYNKIKTTNENMAEQKRLKELKKEIELLKIAKDKAQAKSEAKIEIPVAVV